MSTSLITKKQIARAFKKTLKEKNFEKLSVVEIMDKAGIRRQTFYKYFVDKYQLMDWIFETELKEQVEDNLTYTSGLNLLQALLYYFDSNQQFYQDIFQIEGQNNFFNYFHHHCHLLIKKIVRENLPHLTEPEFFISYHAQALAGLIRNHLIQGQDNLENLYPQIKKTLLFQEVERTTHGTYQ